MARTAFRASVVAFLLLVVAGAGCIGGQDWNDLDPLAGGIQIRGDGACPRTVVSNCDDADQDPSAPWIVSGLRLERGRLGPGILLPTVGIRIEALQRDLVIQDFEIDGFHDGIAIKEFNCAACDLHLDKGVIKTWREPTVSSDADCDLVPTSFGIHQYDATLASVSISNVQIELPGGGATCFDSEVDGFDIFSFNTGGSAAMTGWGSRYVMRNVSVEFREESVGSAIDLGAPDARVELDGVTIKGTHNPISLRGSHLRLVNVETACGKPRLIYEDAQEPLERFRHILTGVILSDAIDVEIADLRISDCHQVGLLLEGPQSPTLSMERFELLRNGFGMRYDRVNYSPTADLVDDPVGDSVGKAREWEPGIFLRDGLVQDNRLVGIHSPRLLDAARLQVQGNGWDWRNAPDDDWAGWDPSWSGGLITDTLGMVSDSSFEGNVPYAVVAPRGTTGGLAVITSPLDARNNWWGDEGGPRVRPLGGVPSDGIGPERGDNVSEGVQFVPFRTTSPALADRET